MKGLFLNAFLLVFVALLPSCETDNLAGPEGAAEVSRLII
jgi:hypothetical protein